MLDPPIPNVLHITQIDGVLCQQCSVLEEELMTASLVSSSGRASRIIALGASLTLLAVGCSNEGNDDDVTLSFAWWGSDTRHDITEEIIEIYEQENPGVTIDAMYGGSFEDHWDRLATQTAAADAPDIIQMDEQYLREYAERGALLELDDVDVSLFDDTSVENGRVDGDLYAVTMGLNAQVLVANPSLFDDAGVDMPDDQTWTWDDFADIAGQISEHSDDVWGSAGPLGIGPFQVWLRQQGKNVSTQDGELGFDAADAAEYFRYFQELQSEGVLPPASLIQEDSGAGDEQSLSGTGREGMATRWTNQAVGLSHTLGTDVELLRYPTVSGDASDADAWFKSSMYLSAAATTDHPEEVQDFIDFFVNSEDAGRLSMVERGIPPNSEIRDLIAEDLDGMDAETVDFIDSIEEDLGDPEPITPVGGSDFQPTLTRYQIEVFFERMTPDEAAESMVEEMQAQIDQ